MSASLIVLGSANTDLTVTVKRHPLPGETLMGGDLVTATGGKGANQALAAARAGAMPLLLGAVGDDANGRALLDALGSGGVDVSSVAVVTGTPTGVALITLDAAGENSIVVSPGANASVDATAVATRIDELAGPGTVLLAQLEVPLEVVEAAARALERHGGRLVLNLSPSRAVESWLLELCDPLVVNAAEAGDLLGRRVDADSAADAAAALLARCRSVVITLGGEGAVAAGSGGDLGTSSGGGSEVAIRRRAPQVDVVDTTGAGDAFAGALAAELAEGASLDQALDRGIAAGAAAVEWPGAQPPAPQA